MFWSRRALPVEAGALRYVEIRDLDVPSADGELAGGQAGKRRLAYPTLLRDYTNDNRHMPALSLNNEINLGRKDEGSKARTAPVPVDAHLPSNLWQNGNAISGRNNEKLFSLFLCES
jgi:hypothetical protein